MLSLKSIEDLSEVVREHLLQGNPTAVDVFSNMLYVWLDMELYEYQLPPIESMTEIDKDMLAIESARNPASGRQWLVILTAKEMVPELSVMILASVIGIDLMIDAVEDAIKILMDDES